MMPDNLAEMMPGKSCAMCGWQQSAHVEPELLGAGRGGFPACRRAPSLAGSGTGSRCSSLGSDPRLRRCMQEVHPQEDRRLSH